MRRCWVNFQCQGVLLTLLTVGQGPIVLSVGAGGGCLDIFSLIYHFSFLSPSLWETTRYRLKYCLKGPLSPKQATNQPTKAYIWNMPIFFCSKKNVRSFCNAKASLIFSTKNTSVFGYKVVNHLTSWPLYDAIKLMILWTTGPRWLFRCNSPFRQYFSQY